MRGRKFVTLLALSGLAGFSLSANGQTPLLFGDENAFYLKGGYSESRRINLPSAELGCIFHGVAGLTLNAGKLGYRDFNVYGLSLAPSLSLRPNFKGPIRIAVAASYTANLYPSDQLKLAELTKLHESAYGFSASLFSHLRLGKKAAFLPMLGVQYISSAVERKNQSGASAQAGYNAVGMEIFAGWRFDILPTSFLVIAPGVVLFEGENVYAINGAIGFKKAPREKATRLPNFRRKFPQYEKIRDEEILATYRKKYSHLRRMDDDRLIALIETKYQAQKSNR